MGVAVNITEVPAQIGFSDDATTTPTGRFGLTVIVTLFDTAGLPVAQVALELSSQVMTSPFAGTEVYVTLVAPVTFVPFTFH